MTLNSVSLSSPPRSLTLSLSFVPSLSMKRISPPYMPLSNYFGEERKKAPKKGRREEREGLHTKRACKRISRILCNKDMERGGQRAREQESKNESKATRVYKMTLIPAEGKQEGCLNTLISLIGFIRGQKRRSDWPALMEKEARMKRDWWREL